MDVSDFAWEDEMISGIFAFASTKKQGPFSPALPNASHCGPFEGQNC